MGVVCLCATCMPSAQGNQKRASNLLQLKLQTYMSCHVWGIEPRSSGRRASALNL